MAIRTHPDRIAPEPAERPPALGRDPVGAWPKRTPIVPPHSTRPRAATRPSLAGRPHPDRPAREVGPAGRVLVIGLTCFLLWGLLAAPSLRRSAESSPLGIRRTAALSILRPLAGLSTILGLDRLGWAADRALGRTHGPQRIPPIAAIRSPSSSSPSTARTTSPSGSSAPLASSDRGVRPRPSLSPSLSVPIDPGIRLRHPTKAHPLRVLAVGDSIGADLAIGLARALSGRKSYLLETDAREATGLARPDYFNWAYQVALDVRDFGPDVVVAAFGANDAQSFLAGGRPVSFGSTEWKKIYRRRVARVMAEVAGSGRPLIWVGMPPMASNRLSQNMRMIDALFRAEAAKHRGVIYMDAWALFAGSNGAYSAYLAGSSGGEQLMRTSDGVHLTAAGLDRLGGAVLRVLTTLWKSPR
jgi:hypothetical protein